MASSWFGGYRGAAAMLETPVVDSRALQQKIEPPGEKKVAHANFARVLGGK